VADLVKATIAKLGENIKIKQFVRLALGEWIRDNISEFQISNTSFQFLHLKFY
jgi:hypothetical protein